MYLHNVQHIRIFQVIIVYVTNYNLPDNTEDVT